MITSQQLNQVAELLGTNDKNVVISAIIKTFVDAGMSVSSAYDEVFGAGSYAQLAGNVWEALQ